MVTAFTRIYANLVLHVVYLCGLTVVILDHVKHPTTLQAKLIGFTLSIALLILSVLALTTYSTPSTLELTRSIIPDQKEYIFTPGPGDGYKVDQQTNTEQGFAGVPYTFSNNDNIKIQLPFSFPLNQDFWDEVYINRNGIIAFGDSFSVRKGEEYYMTQTSHHYSPLLSRQFEDSDNVIAPLLFRARSSQSDTLLVDQTQNSVTFFWKNIEQDVEGIRSYIDPIPKHSSFYATLFEDGQFILGHLDINAYLYDSAMGMMLEKAPGTMGILRLQSLQSTQQTIANASASRGIVVNTFSQFRTGIHNEVSRFLWILIGAILLIGLIFPLISRTSIFRPLQYLLQGVKHIEKGQLETRVPVTTNDEFGYLTYHFNNMVRSLQEAQNKLIAHNENLEKEVSARTEEVLRQKRQIEIQARELIEMDEVKSQFLRTYLTSFARR